MQTVVAITYLVSVYTLLSVGYVIVYRSSRVLNLAHGDLMALGGYILLGVGYLVRSPSLAAVIVVAVGTATGLGVHWLLMRPLSGYSPVIAVLMTIALAFFLRGLIQFVWGASMRRPAVELGVPTERLSVAGATVTTPQLAMLVAAVVVYVGVLVAVRLSTWGRQMRAVAENPRVAAYRGIAIDRVYALSWGLAVAIAMVAGMIHGLGASLTPSVGVLGLKAFPVALIGGLDSLEGILPAAVLVAIAEQMTILHVSPILGEVVPFLLMLAILIVRPWGLLGTEQELERI